MKHQILICGEIIPQNETIPYTYKQVTAFWSKLFTMLCHVKSAEDCELVLEFISLNVDMAFYFSQEQAEGIEYLIDALIIEDHNLDAYTVFIKSGLYQGTYISLIRSLKQVQMGVIIVKKLRITENDNELTGLIRDLMLLGL